MGENRPYPHGMSIGGTHDLDTTTGIVRIGWWCVFDMLDDGRWSATYVADEQEIDALKGHGETPREAFESLIKVWTFANAGEETPVMRALLPGMRTFFTDHGFLFTEDKLAQLGN